MNIESIARICHQTNKALCESLGDNSQDDWESTDIGIKASAIAGVLFRLDNPTAPDSAQHEAWCHDKLAAGWTYGPTKNPALKTHPCLVPYDALPLAQRAKDALFVGVVDALRPLLDQNASEGQPEGKEGV